MMVYSVVERSAERARIRIIDANGSAHRVRVTGELRVYPSDDGRRCYRVDGYGSDCYYLRRWREQQEGR